MRTKFNLDTLLLNGFTIMVHGDTAVGKTHLEGDMLLHESQFGKVKYINVAGEDGMLTISGLGLGEIGETITEYDDYMTILDECAKEGYQAFALDSLHALARLAKNKVTGGKREPIIPSRDQMNAGMQNEWPEVHRLMELARIKTRSAAKYVMVVATSDKSIDGLDLSTRPKASLIAPNLPGREATDCKGWFDFMGFLELKATSPGNFSRTFSLVPDGITSIRQRLPNMITKPIKLPDGKGGWLAIKTEIEKASKR